MPRRLPSLAALAHACALLLLLWMLAPATAGAIELPPDVEERVIATGLNQPTAFTQVPDGRIFVAEKGGRVRVVQDGALAPRPVLDLGDRVADWGDRGLLGLAADRDFEHNGRLYLLYTYDTDPSLPEGSKVSRLTRITVRADNTVEDPGRPETVLLGRDLRTPCPVADGIDCLPSEARWHSIGTVRVDPGDGTLWVGSGDATIIETDAPRAFRTLSPESLAGKILHVDTEGRGLPGHPFCPGEADLSRNCTKVWAMGFRNPFRFTLGLDGPIVGDVGYNRREELNLVRAGGNYGWPCREGSLAQFDGSNAQCEGLVFDAPAYEYAHTDEDGRFWNASITAGPLLTGDAWPPAYRGSIVFADYARQLLSRLTPGAGGGWTAAPFGTDSGALVDLQQGADGGLLALDIYDAASGEDPPGTLKEIAYAPGNKRPVTRIAADRRFGPLPLDVAFDAGGSTDPDGDALTYAWDLDGDGADDATGAQATRRYTDAGPVQVRLSVSDGTVTVRRRMTVWPGNTPPEVTVEAPSAWAAFASGTRVFARARATDAEDGELEGCQVEWTLEYVHAEHVHYFGGWCGPVGSFTADTLGHGAEGHFRLRVAAVDNAGAKTEQAVELRPVLEAGDEATPPAPAAATPAPPPSAALVVRPRRLILRSRPSGAPLDVAGLLRRAPATAMVRPPVAVAAPRTFVRRGMTQRFLGWSDGGARRHVLTDPVDGGVLTARFAPQPGFALLDPVARVGARAITLRLRCAGVPVCRGRLVARVASGLLALGARPVRLAQGRTRSITLPLTAAGSRALAQAAPGPFDLEAAGRVVGEARIRRAGGDRTVRNDAASDRGAVRHR